MSAYELSDPARIRMVRDSLAIWAKNNGIEPYEIRRAMALLMREQDQNRGRKAKEE